MVYQAYQIELMNRFRRVDLLKNQPSEKPIIILVMSQINTNDITEVMVEPICSHKDSQKLIGTILILLQRGQ